MVNLRKWSQTATGNASVAGGANTINFAEGQTPGSVNNSAREMMAQLRSVYTPSEWGWVENSATASVASQTTFKLAGNQTTDWVAPRRWRLKSGSTTRYGTVVSSSFTVETTVTVTVDSGSLSASHSLAALAAIDANHIPTTFVTSASLATSLGTYVTSASLATSLALYASLGGTNTFSATQAFSGGFVVPSTGNALVTGSGGLGYGTGSGGAVTQITNRTTGVTLNKTNGQITMFTAAGTTTWQTFVVTNSAVAATDTILLSVNGSSNTYVMFVSSVSAGAFAIAFSAVQGTASDTPKINFSVIKAVTA